MEKKIKDGMVAVLYAPNFGAGWYSWHGVEALLYDPKVVDMVEEKASGQTIESYCNEKYGNEYHYYGGCDDLHFMWLPIGTHFYIHEYNGAETVEVREEINWNIA